MIYNQFKHVLWKHIGFFKSSAYSYMFNLKAFIEHIFTVYKYSVTYTVSGREPRFVR